MYGIKIFYLTCLSFFMHIFSVYLYMYYNSHTIFFLEVVAFIVLCFSVCFSFTIVDSFGSFFFLESECHLQVLLNIPHHNFFLLLFTDTYILFSSASLNTIVTLQLLLICRCFSLYKTG